MRLVTATAAFYCGLLFPHTARAPLVVAPVPQRITETTATQIINGWPVGCDETVQDAAILVARLTGSTVGTVSDLPQQHFIAVGLLSPNSTHSTSSCPASNLQRLCGRAVKASKGNCLVCVEQHFPPGACTPAEIDAFCSGPLPATPFSALATARGVTAADTAQIGLEGYVLDIQHGAVLLAAHTEAGLFYGFQTLRQVLIPAPHTSVQPAPTVRIVDWPSTSMRGAYMFGMPAFDSTAPPMGDPGVQWMVALAERMAELKLNTGVVVDGFFEWLNPDGQSQPDLGVLTKLREIKSNFDRLHIAFVPSLGCGSGGQENGDTAAENTAEGVWVQGARWTFNAQDVARPDVGLYDLRLPPNGNFSGGVDPRKGAPVGWFTEMGTLNTMEWSLVSESPWPGGNSMKCTVTDPPGGSSSYLYSNDLSVLPGQMLQLHFWTKLVQPEGENLPKFELIFSGGGALELDIGGEASDDMRLRPLPGHQLLPKAADWTEAQQTFRVPLGVTTMSIMIRLQGASTATWWITGVELLNLDASLRNIIRTGDTDIELVDASTGLQYELGTDFVVNNPKTENTAHHLYTDMLDEYRISRLSTGRIPPRGSVLASFDYLPGKVNVQGHSTPGAFGERSYYTRLEAAVNATMEEFQPLWINFDHDEIRGMARDSRSLRLGLSNAELLARDLNAMQAMVESNNPRASALFWDDMLSPYHNGGNCNYGQITGGGRPGCTDGALTQGLVSNNITFYSWAYGHSTVPDEWDATHYTDAAKITNAPAVFGATATHSAYPWVASPLADQLNIVWWAEAVNRSSSALGFIDTSWDDDPRPEDFGDLPTVSQCAWNIENCISAIPH